MLAASKRLLRMGLIDFVWMAYFFSVSVIGVADVGDFEGVAVQIPSSAEREIEEGLTVALLVGDP